MSHTLLCSSQAGSAGSRRRCEVFCMSQNESHGSQRLREYFRVSGRFGVRGKWIMNQPVEGEPAALQPLPQGLCIGFQAAEAGDGIVEVVIERLHIAIVARIPG